MSTRPNLLLFMPDQLRADAVGCFDAPTASTPNIDQLASRGTRFSRAYAQHSVCSQSRVSMFTGWYPHVSGHRTLTHLLQPHEPNVFHSLRQGGYHVAMAGARGDMMGEGVTAASSDRFGFTRAPDRDALRAFFGAGVAPDDPRYYSMWGPALAESPFDLDEATIDTSIDWLTEGMPEPWCLFVPLIYPHPPFTAPEPWYSMHDRDAVQAPQPRRDRAPRFHQLIRDRYGLDAMTADDWIELKATYFGMVSRVDDQLGRVMRAIEQADASDRTVTFFFTDHGEYLGDYGLVEKWPSGLDDCLVRNPLIIDDPREGGGVAADGFVELVDLTPTLLDYAEVEPSWTQFGRSLRPVIEDPSVSVRDAAFSEGGFLVAEEPLLESGASGHYGPKQAIQHDEPEAVGKAMAVRVDGWTYVERLYEGPELFDTQADPHELRNLAGRSDYAEIQNDLKDRLFRWLFETSDVIPWAADPRIDNTLRDQLSG